MAPRLIDFDIDCVPDALLLIRSGRIERANVAARELLGRAALDGVMLDEVLVAGELARITRVDGQRAAGWDLPQTMRTRFRRPDGTEVFADIALGAERDGARVLSARDVTRAKRAEDLMAELALSGVPSLTGPDALFDVTAPVFEALGWTVAFVEVVDPATTITLRVFSPPDDPVGAYGRSLIGVRKPMSETPVVAHVLREGRPLFLDNVPNLLEGDAAAAVALSESMMRARVARSAWCPIRQNERIAYLLAVIGRDLTVHDFVPIQLFAAEIGTSLRLCAMHEELLRGERLSSLGEMAAVVAHEVRSPIAAILAAATALRRAPQREELLEVLQSEANRLRQLSGDLLGFAAPTAPRPELVTIAPAVHDAIAAAARDATREVRAAGVKVQVAPDASDAFVDPVLLRRALVNLVANAMDHVARGGRIEVSASRGDGRVNIRVFNDGAPIDPRVADRIFEPFLTTRASGTGLGLAIVRRLAADLGGTVQLDDSGAGVAFTLSVPTSAH